MKTLLVHAVQGEDAIAVVVAAGSAPHLAKVEKTQPNIGRSEKIKLLFISPSIFNCDRKDVQNAKIVRTPMALD